MKVILGKVILGIIDLMRGYTTRNLLQVLRSGGGPAVYAESRSAETYYNERKVEATALAFKLPPSKDREKLISSISSCAHNQGLHITTKATFVIAMKVEGVESRETKKYGQESIDFYEASGKNRTEVLG